MAAGALMPRGAIVLIYHGVGVTPPAGADGRERKYWVLPEALRGHLVALRQGQHGMGRLCDSWAGPHGEGSASSAVVLTFDDGRATDYEVVLPLLLAAGAHAEFFVNTATIGQTGYLTWSQVTEMCRAGMSFQSHAHDHVVLPGLPPRLLKNELHSSKRLLEDRLGAGVDFLAAPYGLVDRRVIETAHEVGYRAVCTSLAWPARPGAPTVNRVPVYRDTTIEQFAAILGRQLSAFLPGLARTAFMYLPKRVLLKVSPRRLGARLQTEGLWVEPTV
jgi:peptidoglycan/xylan/chitin deacetylase (PgdA/CDA1 family)